MAYEVLADFRDKDGKVYRKGDEYKKKLAKNRVDALTTKENDYDRVFLKEVKAKKE